MVGKATVTMLISRIDMNMPTMSTVSGSRQAVRLPSPPVPPVPGFEGLPTSGEEVGPLAGDVVTPLAGLAPGPVTTTPPCHKKRQVLYPFSSTAFGTGTALAGAGAPARV